MQQQYRGLHSTFMCTEGVLPISFEHRIIWVVASRHFLHSKNDNNNLNNDGNYSKILS